MSEATATPTAAAESATKVASAPQAEAKPKTEAKADPAAPTASATPAAPAAKAAAAPAASAAKEEAKKEVDTSKLTAAAKKVLDQVEGMSILELAELVKVMEDKFGVAAAPVAVAAAPGGAAGADAGAAVSSTANVILKEAGGQKIAVIKAVREATGLGLKEAKDLVDGAPKAVKEGLKRAEAEELKKKLEAAGATVELK